MTYAQIKREEGLEPPSTLKTEDRSLIAAAVWIEGIVRIEEVQKVFAPWLALIDDAPSLLNICPISHNPCFQML